MRDLRLNIFTVYLDVANTSNIVLISFLITGAKPMAWPLRRILSHLTPCGFVLLLVEALWPKEVM